MSPAVITLAGPGACLHHSRELEELREGEGPSKAEKERGKTEEEDENIMIGARFCFVLESRLRNRQFQ